MTKSHAERNYMQHVFKELQDYRAYGFLCDTVINSSDGQLRAHSVILAAGSPVFKSLLETDSENVIRAICRIDMSTVMLELIVSFMYSGSLTLPPDFTAQQIKELAHSLQELRIDFSELGDFGVPSCDRPCIVESLEADDYDTSCDPGPMSPVASYFLSGTPRETDTSQLSQTVNDIKLEDFETLPNGSQVENERTQCNQSFLSDHEYVRTKPSNATLNECDNKRSQRLFQMQKIPVTMMSAKHSECGSVVLKCETDVPTETDIVKSEVSNERRNCLHHSECVCNEDSESDVDDCYIVKSSYKKSIDRAKVASKKRVRKKRGRETEDASRLNGGVSRSAASGAVRVNGTNDKVEVSRSDPIGSDEPFPEDGRRHSCPHCIFRSKYRTNLVSHMRSCHSAFPFIRVKNFKCSLCPKAFRNNPELKQHMTTHSGERPHKCATCGRMFAQINNLRRHQSVHSSMKPHLCERCGKGFTRSRFLKNHIAKERCERDTGSTYQCHQCSRVFGRHMSLVRHCAMAHGSFSTTGTGLDNDGKPEEISLSPLLCDTCGKTCVSVKALKMHEYTHRNADRLTCPVCRRVFASVFNVQLHLRRVHTEVRAYKCTECLKSFATKPELGSHMVRHVDVVSAGGNYQCDKCTKTFADPSQLQWHVRTHGLTRRFKCDLCGKAFIHGPALVNHVRTHTGEKPFKCSDCDMGFAQECHLKRHMMRHTGYKPYACEICPKAYQSKTDLIFHYKRFHKLGMT